nr:hypothetical protein [Curtobacterium flaccumfaciens]
MQQVKELDTLRVEVGRTDREFKPRSVNDALCRGLREECCPLSIELLVGAWLVRQRHPGTTRCPQEPRKLLLGCEIEDFTELALCVRGGAFWLSERPRVQQAELNEPLRRIAGGKDRDIVKLCNFKHHNVLPVGKLPSFPQQTNWRIRVSVDFIDDGVVAHPLRNKSFVESATFWVIFVDADDNVAAISLIRHRDGSSGDLRNEVGIRCGPPPLELNVT